MLDAQTPDRIWEGLGVLDIDRGTQRGLELATIGLEDGRALVCEEISVLGIHNYRDLALFRRLHRRSNQRRSQYSLVVILEHNGIRVVYRAQRSIDETRHLVASDIGILLFVEAHHLLRPRQNTRLGCRPSADILHLARRR